MRSMSTSPHSSLHCRVLMEKKHTVHPTPIPSPPLFPSLPSVHPALTERTTVDSVCLPNVTSPVIRPCQEIANIESACLLNGTSSLALLAVFSRGKRDGDGCDGYVSESDGRGLVLYANWCARPGSDYWERHGGYEDWQRGVGIHEYGINGERE
jgi:hypothetical protein